MYIVSAVAEKNAAKVALYNEEYKLVSKKLAEGNDLSSLVLALLAEAGVKAEEVAYIGVAVEENVPSLSAYAEKLEKTVGIKSYATALISARALGEAYLAGDTATLVLLKIEETVECGVVIDKKVYAGVDQKGGKLGHHVINHGGFACTCGKTGCFEAYASNAGLQKIAKEAGVAGAETITHKALFVMDTPEAKAAQKTYVDFLAAGVTNIINLFQPSELVLEGSFTEAGGGLTEPFTEFILREQYTRSSPNKSLLRAPKADADIALLGAALLGR